MRGTTIDYTFYPVARGLPGVLAEAACVELSADADGLLTFGRYDVCVGGGSHPWLAVRPSDGKVFSLDAECDAPLRLLNSSMQAFTATFKLLDSILRDRQPIPQDLSDSLRALDPSAFDQSEWSAFANHIQTA